MYVYGATLSKRRPFSIANWPLARDAADNQRGEGLFTGKLGNTGAGCSACHCSLPGLCGGDFSVCVRFPSVWRRMPRGNDVWKPVLQGSYCSI